MTTQFKSIDYLNSDDTLTSAQQDALEACHFCGQPILGEVHLSDDDYLEHFCSEKCVGKYETNQDEAEYAHNGEAL